MESDQYRPPSDHEEEHPPDDDFTPSPQPYRPARNIRPSQSSPENRILRQRKPRPTKLLAEKNEEPSEINLKKAQHAVEAEDSQTSYEFLEPKVECLIWKKEGVGLGQTHYLAKWRNKSYYQVSWLTKEQLKEVGFEVNSNSLKTLANRMKKTLELKLKEQHFFNPRYLRPDRILNSTDLFTAIHHKRANIIQGKWSETILLVTQKLVNFVKKGFPFGTLLQERFTHQDELAHNLQSSISLGQVLSKVYLGYYQHHTKFWHQVGSSIRNFLAVNKGKGDYQIVGQTIRQAAIFLYTQWFYLTIQRYQHFIPNEFKESQAGKQEVAAQRRLEGNVVLPFCQTNIFLTQKVVDPPKNDEELSLLNPTPFFFLWLDPQAQSFEPYLRHDYRYLNSQDMAQLDLNREVDKLYFVKWQQQSYLSASWQLESTFQCPQKIQQFKNNNKITNKQVREQFEVHQNVHKILLSFTSNPEKKKTSNVQKMEASLYHLNVGKLKKQDKQPPQYKEEDKLIFKNYRTLKKFQLQSLNWLIKNWYEGRNSILADQMGLGKTIQTIAFLYHLHSHENMLGPFLVLAPLTTLPQWRREIEEWTHFNCLLYYDEGGASARQAIQDYEFYHLHTTRRGDIIASQMPKFQVLLTNYELFVADVELFLKIPFQHVVLDEAHRLKNKQAKQTMTISRLPCVRKTLLTGTPIQNNTKELWTLLNFIEPLTFRSEQQFLSQYSSLSSEQQVKEFKKMLKPYLLRRVKEDVESSIPRLSQTIIDVEMSNIQKTYYRGLIQKNKNGLLKGLSSANFNSISIQLRKCCNHPFLISKDVEQQIQLGALTEQQKTDKFIQASGKTILLIKLLEKFKREQKKVLIFSQFVIMLQLLKPQLQFMGYKCQLLTGSQSSIQRHQSISRFTQKEADLFLISTKAGGVGINLIVATEIVIFDSDWNPQNDIQATARAHRIGQKHEVTVYRLITAHSYESEMFRLSSKKLGLDKAIFTGSTFKSRAQFDQAQKQLTKEEIQTLLKKGVLGFLQSQGNQEDFFNQSIQDILSKNTRKVEYAVPQSSTNFSKTTFKGQTEGELKVDSPDFWQKALKHLDTPLERLVKKKDTLKEHKTIQQQQQLLLQVYSVVVEIAKQKTSVTGFNTTEQYKLQKFIEAIEKERHFHRHLRDIASQLSQELQKPTRRFKLRPQDIIVSNYQQQPTHYDQGIHSPKKIITRNKEPPNTGLNSIPEDYSQMEFKKEPYQYTPNKQKQKEEEEGTPKKEEDEKPEQDFQKLCHQCLRPKCTISCQGLCGRLFHQKCFQQFGQLKKTPEARELDEYKMDFYAWKKARQKGRTCYTCLNQQYTCSICLKQGVYKEEWKSKKNAKAKFEFNEDPNVLLKCSYPHKCNRLYHLKCLYSAEYQGKFADHGGKIITDTSQFSPYFRCPAHYCKKCYGIDPKHRNVHNHTCILCCNTFHEKCSDKEEFVRIAQNYPYHICTKHHSRYPKVDHLARQIAQFSNPPVDRAELVSRKHQEKRKRRERQKQQVSDPSFNIQPSQIERASKKEKKQKKKKREQQAQQQSSNLRRSLRFKADEPIQQLQMPRKKSKKQKKKQKHHSRDKSSPLQQQEQFQQQEKPSPAMKIQKMIPEEKSYMMKEEKMIAEQPPQYAAESELRDYRQSKKEESHLSAKYESIDQSNKTVKKMKKTSSYKKQPNFSYADFQLTPISEFDFSEYHRPWCRYCGSRFASKFEKGPWEGGYLCLHHFELWKKQKLKLEKYKELPSRPIHKEKDNELIFLNVAHESYSLSPKETIQKLRQMQDQ